MKWPTSPAGSMFDSSLLQVEYTMSHPWSQKTAVRIYYLPQQCWCYDWNPVSIRAVTRKSDIIIITCWGKMTFRQDPLSPLMCYSGGAQGYRYINKQTGRTDRRQMNQSRMCPLYFLSFLYSSDNKSIFFLPSIKIGSSLHLPECGWWQPRTRWERREYNKSVTETHGQYAGIAIFVRTLIVVIPQPPNPPCQNSMAQM